MPEQPKDAQRQRGDGCDPRRHAQEQRNAQQHQKVKRYVWLREKIAYVRQSGGRGKQNGREAAVRNRAEEETAEDKVGEREGRGKEGVLDRQQRACERKDKGANISPTSPRFTNPCR